MHARSRAPVSDCVKTRWTQKQGKTPDEPFAAAKSMQESSKKKAKNIPREPRYPWPRSGTTQYYRGIGTRCLGVAACSPAQTLRRRAVARSWCCSSACSVCSCRRSRRSGRGSSLGSPAGPDILFRSSRCVGGWGWGGSVSL